MTRAARPGEDNFAHPERTTWLLSQIPSGARVAEVGCGTGWGVTLPLLLAGVDVVGADLDQASVEYGRTVLGREGVSQAALKACDLRELPGIFDVAIASELLEHLPDAELRAMLRTIRTKLRPDGLLLVTTPNGYGWYEFEAALWRRTGMHLLIERTRIGAVVRRVKLLIVSGATFSRVPSTLASCPHARRFTLRDLNNRLHDAGFETLEARGSVMFCGPFSELIFGGARSIQRANARLGRRYPRFASDFYVAARAHLDAAHEESASVGSDQPAPATVRAARGVGDP